jgi:DNA-binding MarR family transcriptional regulator
MDIITQLTRQMNTILTSAAASYAHTLRSTDLRAAQLPYLMAVCEHPGMSQDALAGYLGVDKSNVTRQLSQLETLGYVARETDTADRRRLFVHPTDRAFDLLPGLVDAVSDCQRELTRGMSAEEKELLCELMTRMARNAARLSAQRETEQDQDD